MSDSVYKFNEDPTKFSEDFIKFDKATTNFQCVCTQCDSKYYPYIDAPVNIYNICNHINRRRIITYEYCKDCIYTMLIYQCYKCKNVLNNTIQQSPLIKNNIFGIIYINLHNYTFICERCYHYDSCEF